jgi:hypothetical protein
MPVSSIALAMRDVKRLRIMDAEAGCTHDFRFAWSGILGLRAPCKRNKIERFVQPLLITAIHFPPGWLKLSWKN